MDKIKQRKHFYKSIRLGEIVKAITPFEIVYSICYSFKSIYKGKSIEDKINKLVELSNKRVDKVYAKNNSYKTDRVKKFPTSKPCWVCGDKANYHHHLIGLNNGGYNSGINRIPICHSCHKKVHSWLK